MDKLTVAERLDRDEQVPVLELCDYLSGYFLPIKETKWVTGKFDDGRGRKCALAHLGRSTKLAEAAQRLFQAHGYSVEEVNDASRRYQEQCPAAVELNHPKGRILAFLAWIRERLVS